jgi:hypothetical protein
VKRFTAGAKEVSQLFDDATALYKEARAELEKGNGNPRDQSSDKTNDYRNKTLH